MSENKEYVTQEVEYGAIHISEEVVASVASMAIQEVEGVYGLSGNVGADNGKITKKVSKSVRLVISEDDEISIDCYIVVLYGYSVVEVAKAVQDAVTTTVESTIGRKVRDVNVSISGISLPRTVKK